MDWLLRALIGLAAAGFLACAAVHVLALLGRDLFSEVSWPLFVNLCVVWLATVLVAGQQTRLVPSQDFWKAALRGCPEWMRKSVYGLFGYFLLYAGAGILGGGVPAAPGGSAALMAFYAIAYAVLYSRLRLGPLRIADGHEVPPLAAFCPTCGRPVPPR